MIFHGNDVLWRCVKNMNNDTVLCPLTGKNISIDDCMENREVKENFIPPKYKKKENWKEICKNCRYHNY